MNNLMTMTVLDGTDDLLEEPTGFVFGHLLSQLQTQRDQLVGSVEAEDRATIAYLAFLLERRINIGRETLGMRVLGGGWWVGGGKADEPRRYS